MSSDPRPTVPVDPVRDTSETVVVKPGEPAPSPRSRPASEAPTAPVRTTATETVTETETETAPVTRSPPTARQRAGVEPAWGRRERGWLWIFFAAYAAAALPWLWRALDAPLPAIAGWLLAAGLGQLLLAWLAAQVLRGRALAIVRALLHTGATLVLCWVWYLAGGLDNPAFLLLLALPLALVAASRDPGASPWLALWATAGSIVVAVAVIAWGQSPDLRWYSLRLGLPLEWAVAWAPALGGGEAAAAATGSAEEVPASAFVVVITFIVAILTLAAALGTGVGAVTPAPVRHRARGWRTALEAMPVGWLLVRAADGTVLEVGRRWLEVHALAPDAVRGTILGELIAWLGDDPTDDDATGPDAGQPTLYRLHGVTWAAAVESAPIVFDGEPRTLLTFRRADPREELVRLAGDDPWLLVDERQRAIDFSAAAAQLLPDLHARADIAALHGKDDPRPPAAGWWHPGEGEIRLGGKRMRTTSYLLRRRTGQEADVEQIFVHLRPSSEAS